MRLTLLVAFAILMAGCESTPPTIDHEFETFEAIDAKVTFPDKLPRIVPLKCYPSEEECRVVGYTDSRSIDELEIYKTYAEGNTLIAEANADTATALIQREAAILAASKAQEGLTRLREEQLAWERSERRKDKWYYRVMIVLIGGAAVYASGN